MSDGGVLGFARLSSFFLYCKPFFSPLFPLLLPQFPRENFGRALGAFSSPPSPPPAATPRPAYDPVGDWW